MLLFGIKTLLAAVIISFVSWLAGKKPILAGFITALPLTTMLALVFTQVEWKNSAGSVEYAKSVFVAVPVSLLFFLPFLFAQRLSLSFWTCFTLGIVFLGIGYFIHHFLMQQFSIG